MSGKIAAQRSNLFLWRPLTAQVSRSATSRSALGSRDIQCVRKKDTKMSSLISPIKFRQFCWNLAHSFLNKFAATWCKRFPPHLNNVSILPCETWNDHCARSTIALLDTETPEFIPPQMWSPNSPHLNPDDNSVWKILQEGVKKHASLIWSYQQCHWRMAAAMTMWSSLVHSVLSRCFISSRSVMRILYTSLAIFFTRCYQLDSNLANLKTTVEVG